MTVAHEREIGPGVRRGGFQPVEPPPREDEGGGRRRPRPILGLALGVRTSWVLWWDEEHCSSGDVFLSRSRRESRGLQVLRFRRWLRELLALSQPGLVLYRVPADEQDDPSSLAHNLEGVLLAELEGRVGYVSARTRGEGP